MAGVGGIGLLIGGGSVSGARALIDGGKVKSTGFGSVEDGVAFYSEHHAGIVAPTQDFCCFVAFDLQSAKLADVRDLFRQ